MARECAHEGVDHPRYLLRLIELELIDRERRTVERRIRAARFPATKSFDTFDFTAIPSLNKMLVIELAPSEYNGGTGRECGSKLSAVYRLRALVTIRNVSRSNSAPWRFGRPSRG